MKRIFLLMIVSSLLISCGGRKVNKKMVRTIIGGEWILKNYVDELNATGSPYKAGEKLKGITEMKIITDVNDRNDSISVVAIVNNHEGYTFKLLLEKTSDAIKVNAFPAEISSKEKYELVFDVKNDSVIKLVKYDSTGAIAETSEYLKIIRESTANKYLTIADYISVKTVLNGEFSLVNINDNNPTVAKFYSNGEVKGFQGFSSFRLLTDFIASGVEFDFLMLGNDNISFRPEKEFGLKTFNDRVELYSVVTDSTEFFMQMDKLVYILKRK